MRPVRRLDAAPQGPWTVVRAGGETVSHCMMGIRSNAANPEPGKPQFMISADDQFAVLRVRAAEWSFAGARDIAVTLVTADGTEREPAAAVHGKDLIDIAFGTAPERMAELAASSHLEIRTEGTVVRLPLGGSLRRCCPHSATAWPASASPQSRNSSRKSMLRCVNRCETSLLDAPAAICSAPTGFLCQ